MGTPVGEHWQLEDPTWKKENHTGPFFLSALEAEAAINGAAGFRAEKAGL